MASGYPMLHQQFHIPNILMHRSLLLGFCYSSVSYHPLPLVIQHDFDHSTLIRMNIFVLMPNNQDPQDISWHLLRSSWNPTATLLGPILPFPCSIFASLPPNKMAASKSAWDTDYLSSPSITSSTRLIRHFLLFSARITEII